MTAPAPRSRPLLVPIAALTLAFLGASACGHFEISARAEARDEWKRTYTIARGASLEIKNTNGQIRVDTWDGDTIEVVATRVVKAPSEEQAKTTLAGLKIGESVSASGVVIDGTSMSFAFMLNRSKRVDFAVRAPRWANITLKSTNGEIDVKGVGGMFRADTTNGSIVAAGLSGGADVETTNGGVRLDMAAIGERGVRCSTTNGSITLSLPRDGKASVTARITNGSITSPDLNLTTTEQSRRRLNATLGGGGPRVELETTNGDIQIKGR